MDLSRPVNIDFARPIFGDKERKAVNEVMQGHWLANGPKVEEFEAKFAQLIGVPYALAVNSGSSANLLALAALNLPKGSKVLTSGCGFPATLSPILHLGLEPVLVDYDRRTYNIDLRQVEEAARSVQAAIFAHTMGNPSDAWRILLGEAVPFVEDCCEALGAKYDGYEVGHYAPLATYSFYPSHQITALGGGGMVTFRDKDDYLRAKSLRDWGKTQIMGGYGRSNTKYDSKVDGIDYFEHYTYETVGWNFKLPEANAAFGSVQLERLPEIVRQRKENHDRIVKSLPEGEFYDVEIIPGAEPSWFGVLLTPKRYSGHLLGETLEKFGVRHRPFFAGNITRHKPFAHLRKELPEADFLMENTIFVGCYAGMTEVEVSYVCEAIKEAHEIHCP